MEFAAWARRLSTLGEPVAPEEVRERAWAFGSGWVDLHTRLRGPFSPYYACCGTDQMWRLFAAPDRAPSRLSIDVRQGERWTVVYRELDPSLDWRSTTLRSHRVRGISHAFADTGDHERLRQFAQWVGAMAEEDFPEATAVRLRYDRGPLPMPDQLRAGEAMPRHEATRIVQELQ